MISKCVKILIGVLCMINVSFCGNGGETCGSVSKLNETCGGIGKLTSKNSETPIIQGIELEGPKVDTVNFKSKNTETPPIEASGNAFKKFFVK